MDENGFTEAFPRTIRHWCLVSAVGAKTVFGYTQDQELIIMRRDAEGLADVQRDDIVEFTPKPVLAMSKIGAKTEAKFFRSWPKIIARKHTPQNTRGDMYGQSWKQAHEGRQ